MAVIYKLVDEALWAEAEREGVFRGAGIDAADGFIHLSTAAQVRETARLWFRDGDTILLVGFAEDGLEGLRYEASRGGDLFPHVFAPIPAARAVSRHLLRRGPDGLFVFPEGIA